MGAKTLLPLLSLVVCVAQINGIHLTREIVLSVNPNLISDPQSLSSGLLQQAIKSILLPSRNIANNLADLLIKNSQPEVPDVLEAFNAGIGSKLLVVVDDNIQLDAYEFEVALTSSARKLSQAMYPDNYFQQLAAYKMFQNEIKQVSPNIKVTFAAAKVPVNQLEKLLSKQSHLVDKRDVSVAIQQKSIIDDLINSVIIQAETALCNTLVSQIQNLVNSTLLSWIDELNNIDVSTDGNLLSNVLAGGLQLISFFIEQGLTCSNQWFADSSSDVCDIVISQLTNSTSNSTDSARKRRDVAPTISQRFDVFTLVLTFFWQLISTVINPVLKGGASWGTSLALSAIYVLIDAVFPSLF